MNHWQLFALRDKSGKGMFDPTHIDWLERFAVRQNLCDLCHSNCVLVTALIYPFFFFSLPKNIIINYPLLVREFSFINRLHYFNSIDGQEEET